MKLPHETAHALENLGICTLYLFGSRAQGLEKSTSDFDFGLLLKDPRKLRNESTRLYQEVYSLLDDLLDSPVNLDIVFLDRAPLQLRYHVLRYGRVLIDSDPGRRGEFEERTLEEHADFEPYRRLFEQTTLERIG